MKLILGLGNPGPQYANTRHNAGFLAIDHLAKHFRLSPKPDRRIPAELAEGADFILAKPQTFMNNSGVAATQLLDKFGLKAADLLVIYDDVDLPIGTFRYRLTGSDGGQRGMRSIIQSLQTKDIPRIRIGVGRDSTQDTSDYVLSKFTPDEKEALTEALHQVTDFIATL